jgi:hypothetical protein
LCYSVWNILLFLFKQCLSLPVEWLVLRA